jgi:hypothetical protein
MRLRPGILSLLSVVVVAVAWGISSFVVDPENIGARLALYSVGLLALVAAIVFGIVALVHRRAGRGGGSNTGPTG